MKAGAHRAATAS